jgi:hypothetical protein
MVSTLTDKAKALQKAKTLHSFLSNELELPLGKRAASVETFAAFMGMMRSCNPLHVRHKARAALPVICPLTQRFPEVLVGRLDWYKDVEVCTNEVIDQGGCVMDERKMWRLMLWIWLGNGGNLHQAWRVLEHTPCGRTYRRDDLRQPLEVLRFVIHAVHVTGSLMKVIGSDGLDKKSRLAKRRILVLLEWHKAVPDLVKAFQEGGTAFAKALSNVPGLKGDLTMKEVIIMAAASKYKSVSKVGAPVLPFGQGAKNGALAFLGVPQKAGKDATEHYHRHLNSKIPDLEKAMGRIFPKMSERDCKVTLGDIEPCLCAAFVYAGLVKRLRQNRVKARKAGVLPEDRLWWSAEKLGAPAGFYVYGRDGKREEKPGAVSVPKVPYKKFQLKTVPQERLLTKARMVRSWRFLDGSGRIKRRRTQ